MVNIVWFEEYHPDRPERLGGKNTSLGVMTSAGLPVPPGFAVCANAYDKTLADTGLVGQLAALMAGVDPDSLASVSAAGRAARELVCHVELPDVLADGIREAYAELSRRCGVADVPVAVRSSATCEDQPDASFAGEHDTYLWVRGADSVIDHVRRCWASLFTDRAITYRRSMGYLDEGAAMSVGVQKMVLPVAAGVAFTLNPLDGDRSQVAIEASWGFGESVVGGSVTPDNFLVDKVMSHITRRVISDKVMEYRLGDNDSVVEASVGDDRRLAQCLSDEQVVAVARLARRAEKHYGCPQDVEWALDDQLPEGENVLLLQSRPETVWSREVRAVNPDSTDTYRSIVNTLLDSSRTSNSQHTC